MPVRTVVVCEAQVPFVHGGAEIHVRELVRELVARGSIAGCRDNAELRLEGKEYIVLDGDVINFRHAT